MKHALSMYIFFSFKVIYNVEFGPIKSVILIQKAFFSLTLLKYTCLFFNMNSNDLYSGYSNALITGGGGIVPMSMALHVQNNYMEGSGSATIK